MVHIKVRWLVQKAQHEISPKQSISTLSSRTQDLDFQLYRLQQMPGVSHAVFFEIRVSFVSRVQEVHLSTKCLYHIRAILGEIQNHLQ
jgi:hypothetical protein